MEFLKKVKSCRICKNNKFIKLYKYNKTPIGEDFVHRNDRFKKQKLYPLTLQMCTKCNLVHINEIISPNHIYRNYLYETKTSNTLAEHFKSYASTVTKSLKLKKQDFIIDIGSNDGALLKSFKTNVNNVLGIEPAQHIAENANKKKIKTINSFFNKKTANYVLKKYGKAKLITANNVFANIDNINNWIVNIKKILDKEGFFVFESFYLKDLIKNKVFDFIYHEHLSAFSIKPILFLCKINGLKLVRVDKLKTKGGSLRYYITFKENKILRKKENFKKLINEENKLGIYKKKTYVDLFNYINREKKKLHTFLNKNKEKTIYAFGASITCINLIYQFKINKKIKFLFDDNLIKIGMYSPRDKLPVKKLEGKYLDKEKILLILPWRFQKDIISRHYKKIKKVRAIVQVMPKFKILNLN